METRNERNRILVVDDEADIREILQFNLENEGYSVDASASAEEALKRLREGYQLVLLDVMMGGISGFKMADKLRKEGNNIPIIFLTAKDTENDMLTGFSIGGDDYISKPFSIKEVLARVKSVLKRTAVKETENKEIQTIADGFQINYQTKSITVDKQPVELTKTEFNILSLLALNEGKIFTRPDILDRAWDNAGFVLERTVDVHINRLRKKLGRFSGCIVNRIGYGYTFNNEDNI